EMPQGSPVAAALPASTALPKLVAAGSVPVGARSETAAVGSMEVVQKGSGREPHLLEERLPARVAVQLVQQWVVFHDAETRIAFNIRALQPIECQLNRAAIRISDRD